jgi:hypothetical protein
MSPGCCVPRRASSVPTRARHLPQERAVYDEMYWDEVSRCLRQKIAPAEDEEMPKAQVRGAHSRWSSPLHTVH